MTWTGILHGIYGLGAFASPLVATSMVTKGIPVRSSYEHAGTDFSGFFFYSVPPLLYDQYRLKRRCSSIGAARIPRLAVTATTDLRRCWWTRPGEHTVFRTCVPSDLEKSGDVDARDFPHVVCWVSFIISLLKYTQY